MSSYFSSARFNARILVVLSLVAAALVGTASSALAEASPGYVPGQVIVRFKDGSSATRRAAVRDKNDFKLKRSLPVTGAQLLTVPAGTSVPEAVAALEKDPNVLYAQPNQLYKTTTTPNDPLFGDQWGMLNTGQTIGGVAGTAGADIHATDAWSRTTGNPSLKVGVLDSSPMQIDHPDLAANVWTNPGESGSGRETNGIDDDSNGVIDDVHGGNFYTNTGDMTPTGDHSTQVAGALGAVGDNSVGIAGVAWNSDIISAGAGSSNWLTTDAIARGANYLAARGVEIVNMSFSGGASALLDEIFSKNPQVLWVAAAGNDGWDLDLNSVAPTYPCQSLSPNVICVGASNNTDHLVASVDGSWGSNYGDQAVDIAAPGYDVKTTYTGSSYVYTGGTSLASPIVAGAAALLKSDDPDASAIQIKDALMSGADRLSALDGKVASGRLNVARALDELKAPLGETTVSVVGGTLRVVAGSGQTNSYAVSDAGANVEVTDTGSQLVAGSGCALAGSTAVCSGASAVHVNAGDASDLVTVTSALPARIFGGTGNDALSGGAGDDIVDGGLGDDAIYGSLGTDTADYSSRTAPLNITIDGSAGDGQSGESDTVSTDMENVVGGSGNDIITGHWNPNRLDGGQGDNQLNGLGGDDTLLAGYGTDVFSGGADNDTVTYSARSRFSNRVSASIDDQPNDGQYGEADNVKLDVENLIGSPAEDILVGSSAANRIEGIGGADRVSGGPGADFLYGGAGIDLLDYSDNSGDVKVDLSSCIDCGSPGENDLIDSDFENVTTAGGDDSINGNGSANFIDAGLGSDDIYGGSGDDTVSYASRTNDVAVSLDSASDDGESGELDFVSPGVENVITGSGNDNVIGASAANRVDTRAGDDDIELGDGDDFVDPGIGTDTVTGGAGSDTVSYEARTEDLNLTLNGQADDGAAGEDDGIAADVENLISGYGDDQITGNAQANALEAGSGADVVVGDGGNDSITGDRPFAPFYTEEGTYVGCGAPGGGNDALSGGDGNDRVFGGSGADEVDGGNGDDLVSGELDGKTGCESTFGQMDQFSDDVNGGDGNDSVRFAGGSGLFTYGVKVSLNDLADDGPNTTGLSYSDNVHSDIENLAGGPLNDVLTSGSGNQILEGGAGRDILDAGLGKDLMTGGSGSDIASYASHSIPVFARLDGMTAAGSENESDWILSDVEGLEGGSANDHLIGNSGENEIAGGSGADIIDGGLGDDYFAPAFTTAFPTGPEDTLDFGSRTEPVEIRLNYGQLGGQAGELDSAPYVTFSKVIGGSAADDLSGGNGDETFIGGAGADTIDAGYGGDVVIGGTGSDTIDAGSGLDVVNAIDDAADAEVDCGPDADVAITDSSDDPQNCETAGSALNTIIDSAPPSATNDTTPRFEFHASAAPQGFSCRIDSEPWRACTSPFTIDALPLAEGDHSFAVKAIGTSEVYDDQTPATVEFTVDTTPPDSPTVSGPSSPNNNANPLFTVSSPGGTPFCTVTQDSSPSGYSSLNNGTIEPSLTSDGAWYVYCIATDAAGNTSPMSTTTYVLDTTAPTAPAILSQTPTSPSKDNKPTLTGSAEANSQVKIYADGVLNGTAAANGSGAWSITLPNALADGTRSLIAKATDAAGNQSAGSSALSYVVDTVTPTVSITSPSNGSATFNPTPALTFSVSDAGSHTETCSLDSSPFVACPSTLPGLTPGAHSLTVRSVDAAGNIGTSVSSFTAMKAPSVASWSTTANLTAEGTADWSHWGATTATSWNHKSNGGSQISDISTVGTGCASVARVTGTPRATTWTDGTPTAASTSTTQATAVAAGGAVGCGVGFTVPNVTAGEPMTLRVYGGAVNAAAKLSVWWTSQSGAVATDTNVVSTNTTETTGVYTVTVAAPATTDTLNVSLTLNTSPNSSTSRVRLHGATLTKLGATVVAASSTADLTSTGTLDWAHWGTSSNSLTPAGKASTTLISSPAVKTPTSTTVTQATSTVNPVTTAFSWTGGDSPTSSAGTSTGVSVGGAAGTGLSFTVPAASSSMRTLKLWVGATNTLGRLDLFWGSSTEPALTDMSVQNTSGTTNAVYTINLRHLTAGTTLKVQWSQAVAGSTGRVTLQSAALY